MKMTVGVVGLYVRDQEDALRFYVDRLGFQIHSDATNGGYRWLTVHHPDQPGFQLGLFRPQPPTVDQPTAATIAEVVAKGAMPPLVLTVEDSRAAHDRFAAAGVEFTQEPIARFGSVDASFRRPLRQRLEADRGTVVNVAFYRAGSQAPVPEAAMPEARRARSLHRWIATLFTLAVAANFAMMPWDSPPVWITYALLPPLLFLLATGLVMLVSPWVAAARRARHGGVR